MSRRALGSFFNRNTRQHPASDDDTKTPHASPTIARPRGAIRGRQSSKPIPSLGSTTCTRGVPLSTDKCSCPRLKHKTSVHRLTRHRCRLPTAPSRNADGRRLKMCSIGFQSKAAGRPQYCPQPPSAVPVWSPLTLAVTRSTKTLIRNSARSPGVSMAKEGVTLSQGRHGRRSSSLGVNRR